MKLRFVVEMEVVQTDEDGNQIENRAYEHDEATGEDRPTGEVLPDLMPEDRAELIHAMRDALSTPDVEDGRWPEWLHGSELFVKVVGTPKIVDITAATLQPIDDIQALADIARSAEKNEEANFLIRVSE